MTGGILNLLGGGNGGVAPFQPAEPVGLLDRLAQGLASNSNSLIGFGLGLMGGTREDPYGRAMMGWSAGSQADMVRQKEIETQRKEALLTQQRIEAAKALGAPTAIANDPVAWNAYVQRAMAGPKEGPAAIQEYEYAKRQGFDGSFVDFQNAKRQPLVQIGDIGKQETEYDKTIGKGYAETALEIAKGAQQAHKKLATLDRLEQILSRDDVYTGAGAGLVTEAKRLATAMGHKVEGLDGAEAVRAISNQFALELRNPSGGAGMPGAMSDKDREFLQQSVPGLERTPGGNKLIIDYMRRVEKRSVEVDKLRRDYVRRNGRLDDGFYDALAEYAEASPLFTEADQKAAKARREVPTFDAVPEGARFRAPDGKVYRKRNGQAVPE